MEEWNVLIYRDYDFYDNGRNVKGRTLHYFALILTVLLLPGLLAVPALADETPIDRWINYLDYGYLFDDTNYCNLSGSSIATLNLADLPNTFYNYIDIIVYTDATDLQFSKWNYFNPSLTAVNLGDGYYRFYGDISRTYTNQQIFFRSRAGTGTFVSFLSVRVSTFTYNEFTKTVSGTVYSGGNNTSGQRPILYPADTAAGLDSQVVFDNTTSPPMYYSSRLSISQWQGMDYIQLSFSSYCTSLDSVSVTLDGISIPFDINYINRNVTSGLGWVYGTLFIDLTGIDKTSIQSLSIIVNGTIGADLQGNFYIQNCIGFVEIEPPSVFTVWFTQIGKWLEAQTIGITGSISEWGQKIIDAILGGEAADEFNQGVQDANDKLGEASDAMNDFTLPNPDNILPTIGEFDSAGVSLVGNLLNNDFISPLVIVSLSVWLICMILGI